MVRISDKKGSQLVSPFEYYRMCAQGGSRWAKMMGKLYSPP